MLVYFLQVVSGILLSWFCYRLFLKGRASATTNRYFLLGGLLLPFVLPLVPLSPEAVTVAEPILLPEFTLVANAQVLQQPTGSSSWNWLFTLYVGGVLSLLIYHLSGLFSFLKAIQKAEKADDDSRIFLLEKLTMPFSFFGRIFLPTSLTQEDKQLIVAHEALHLQRMHSWDVLIGTIIHSVLWFFPLMPFYIRDLRQEHEFEVDHLMLKETSFTHYAETLLQFNLKPIHHRLFHSFSSPNLKKRIIMMTKNQKRNTWKLLLLIPVIGSMLYLNACDKQTNQAIEAEKPAMEADQSETDMTANGTEVMDFKQVSSPPQFKDCATEESREAQEQCFLSGTMKHIGENLKYPEAAKEEAVEGKVFVEFIVNKSGSISEAYIKRGIPNPDNSAAIEAVNKAALEVFGTFPELIPAKKDGKDVAIKFVVPISFKLS